MRSRSREKAWSMMGETSHSSRGTAGLLPRAGCGSRFRADWMNRRTPRHKPVKSIVTGRQSLPADALGPGWNRSSSRMLALGPVHSLQKMSIEPAPYHPVFWIGRVAKRRHSARGEASRPEMQSRAANTGCLPGYAPSVLRYDMQACPGPV